MGGAGGLPVLRGPMFPPGEQAKHAGHRALMLRPPEAPLREAYPVGLVWGSLLAGP